MDGEPEPAVVELVQRRAIELTVALVAVAGGLGLVCWALLDWPSIPDCVETLSPGQQQAVDRFRADARTLHVIGAAVVMAVVGRLSAAKHLARAGRRRPGTPTLCGLGVYGALLAVALVEPGALAVPVGLSFWLGFVTVPLTGLLLVSAGVTAPLASRFATASRWAIGVAPSAGWSALLALPAHYAVLCLAADPWCLSMS